MLRGKERRGEDTPRGKSGGEGSGATRGEAQKQEVAGLALSGGGSAALPAVRRSRGAGRRWKTTGLLCNFRKFRGPTVKLKYLLN